MHKFHILYYKEVALLTSLTVFIILVYSPCLRGAVDELCKCLLGNSSTDVRSGNPLSR